MKCQQTLIGLTNFYLYQFYIEKKYAEDYWEFNLKSVGHSKQVLKILFVLAPDSDRKYL